MLSEIRRSLRSLLMSSSTARTLARGVRVARAQSTRQYATKAVEHPAGYVPTAEEFIAQRAGVQEHAAGEF